MGLRIKTPPTVTPLTLAEVKSHLEILGEEDEVRVNRLLKAATDVAESYLGRSLITQTWTWTLDGFPCGPLRVPRAPLQSVTHIKYVADDGTVTTWDSSEYRVGTNSQPGMIEPGWNYSWPTPRTVIEAVEIEFIAGYGDAASDVPEGIRHAIALMIGEWDEYREGTHEGPLVEIPRGAKRLMDQHRIGGLFACAGLSQ